MSCFLSVCHMLLYFLPVAHQEDDTAVSKMKCLSSFLHSPTMARKYKKVSSYVVRSLITKALLL